MAISVYDATGPLFMTGTYVPTVAYVGDPVSMTAAATDDFSGVATYGWDFGDGSTASGDKVSHTYAAPGTYMVTITAIDGAGNAGTTSRAVDVAKGTPPDVPTRGVDFNASSVSGTVLVSVPKNRPAGFVPSRPVRAGAIKPPRGYRQFRPLGPNDNIPVGSIIDATKGVSRLTMATNATSTETQVARFSQGVFKTEQGKGSALTTAVLLGPGNFRTACKPSGYLAKKKKRPRRRLFGSGSGRFRTRGRHSTATVRGTKWVTEDRCDGTLTIVKSGSVTVRDFARRKTIVVKAGHRYLARSRKTR